MNRHIIVIGGGAAGLMAAASAAAQGGQVTLLEKMDAVGRKLLITGKGRCNLTNAADIPEIIKNIPGNGTFLHSAMRQFSNTDLIDFLQQIGIETKVERGGRVFPVSDKARDVIVAFLKYLKEIGVTLRTGCSVVEIVAHEGRAAGVLLKSGEVLSADAVILATGGMSYPGTGSSGDGYVMAGKLGHIIVELKPSLVPLEVEEEWVKDLQGLSLKNVKATLYHGDKKITEEFGEMLFTHFGLSGPIILSISKMAAPLLVPNAKGQREVQIAINLKPALTEDMLDKRIQRDFEKLARKAVKNAMSELLPSKLIDTVIDLSYLDPNKPAHQVTKTERSRLIDVLTALTLTITKTRPIAEAIVTAGGVSTKEVNPSTMESKLIRRLYLAGEVLDVDGYTGGYNLQAAFSTGYVAGVNAASK